MSQKFDFVSKIGFCIKNWIWYQKYDFFLKIELNIVSQIVIGFIILQFKIEI